MKWLSLLMAGLKLAGALADAFSAIQKRREAIQRIESLTAEARAKALLAVAELERALGRLPDGIKERVDEECDRIAGEALGKPPGARIADLFGTGPRP